MDLIDQTSGPYPSTATQPSESTSSVTSPPPRSRSPTSTGRCTMTWRTSCLASSTAPSLDLAIHARQPRRA
jgi:hypothetical protein